VSAGWVVSQSFQQFVQRVDLAVYIPDHVDRPSEQRPDETVPAL
jgi:hypothetical protein